MEARGQIREIEDSEAVALLEGLRTRCGDDCGLYSGKMGVCICYFLLADRYKSKELKTHGEMILGEVLSSLETNGSFDFGTGIAGIGWGLDWLARKTLIDTDVREFLQDLDDEMYKAFVFAGQTDISLSRGMMGRAVYFFRRWEGDAGGHRYRVLCLRECVRLQTELLGAYILGRTASGFVQREDVRMLACFLSFLTRIYPTAVGGMAIEGLFCSAYSLANDYVHGYAGARDSAEQEAALLLSDAWYRAGLVLCPEEWGDTAVALYMDRFGSGRGDGKVNWTVRYLLERWRRRGANIPGLKVEGDAVPLESPLDALCMYMLRCPDPDPAWEEGWLF